MTNVLTRLYGVGMRKVRHRWHRAYWRASGVLAERERQRRVNGAQE